MRSLSSKCKLHAVDVNLHEYISVRERTNLLILEKNYIRIRCYRMNISVCLSHHEQSCCETICSLLTARSKIRSRECWARREFWARNRIFAHRFTACSSCTKIVQNLNSHTRILSAVWPGRERSDERRQTYVPLFIMYIARTIMVCGALGSCTYHLDAGRDVWWASSESALSG